MTHAKPTISIVLPLYNNGDDLADIVTAIQNNIPPKYNFEFLLVNDGSVDTTEDTMVALTAKDPRIKGISFYRNFGHQAALRAGLEHSAGDAVLTMDADFQHPPEMIPKLLQLWEAGHDVVIAQKLQTSEPVLIISALRKLGYLIYKLLGDNKILPGVSDFRLVDKQILTYVNACSESRYLLRGLVMLAAKTPILLPYNVGRRRHGSSQYSITKLFQLFLDSVTSFSLMPLRAATSVGLILALFSLVYMIIILYSRFVLGNYIIEGWTALMFVILFLFSFLFMYLGVLAEYVGAVFSEVKKRPSYVVKNRYNI